MKLTLVLASVASAALSSSLPAAAQPTGADRTLYVLAAPPSVFEWGCFDPCMCPILVQSQVTGTFVLSRSQVDPLFTYYDVRDVRWQVESPTGPVAITGTGTYRIGGEVALSQQLTLDVAFGNGAPQHFDSGLESVSATFPEIRTRVSLHGEWCHDSVLAVNAKPLATASVDGAARGATLLVGPNPSSGSAWVSFSLPRESNVDLGVFDVAGRFVRALVTRESLPVGPHARAWDGRRADGTAAAPGAYVVRLVTQDESVTRVAFRVR